MAQILRYERARPNAEPATPNNEAERRRENRDPNLKLNTNREQRRQKGERTVILLITS
jgi:hypothetical protein